MGLLGSASGNKGLLLPSQTNLFAGSEMLMFLDSVVEGEGKEGV